MINGDLWLVMLCTQTIRKESVGNEALCVVHPTTVY